MLKSQAHNRRHVAPVLCACPPQGSRVPLPEPNGACSACACHAGQWPSPSLLPSPGVMRAAQHWCDVHSKRSPPRASPQRHFACRRGLTAMPKKSSAALCRSTRPESAGQQRCFLLLARRAAPPASSARCRPAPAAVQIVRATSSIRHASWSSPSSSSSSSSPPAPSSLPPSSSSSLPPPPPAAAPSARAGPLPLASRFSFSASARLV
jgi:hypothetical protein